MAVMAGPAESAENAGDDPKDREFRRLRDTERDLDPELADEDEPDEWEKIAKEDELPTFFESIQPLMRRNQRGDGAVIFHLVDEGVTVEAVPLQGDKAIARQQRAGVGMETVHWQRRIALDQAAAAQTRDFFQAAAAHHAALLCRNSCTTRRSSKG